MVGAGCWPKPVLHWFFSSGWSPTLLIFLNFLNHRLHRFTQIFFYFLAKADSKFIKSLELKFEAIDLLKTTLNFKPFNHCFEDFFWFLLWFKKLTTLNLELETSNKKTALGIAAKIFFVRLRTKRLKRITRPDCLLEFFCYSLNCVFTGFCFWNRMKRERKKKYETTNYLL